MTTPTFDSLNDQELQAAAGGVDASNWGNTLVVMTVSDVDCLNPSTMLRGGINKFSGGGWNTH